MNKLVVVGSGIKSMADLSQETINEIKSADKVLYLINEPLVQDWIKRETKHSESLQDLYFAHEHRVNSYHAVTDYILEQYEKIKALVVVFYGHPTMFANPALWAVKKIQENGGNARVIPAISALDYLFADLEIDPGDVGFYTADATDFLIFKRKFDPRSHLFLMQVATIGGLNANKVSNLDILKKHLMNFYPNDHRICIYHPAQYPTIKPQIDHYYLFELENIKIDNPGIMYLAPLVETKKDQEMAEKLRLQLSECLMP